MKSYRTFCRRHRHAFMTMAKISALFTACYFLAGCAVAPWLSDAENLIPVIASSVLTVLSFLAGLTGNPILEAALADATTIVKDVQASLTAIEALIASYKKNPSDTLIEQIEGIAQTIESNLSTILNDAGIPAAVATTIQSWAGLVLSQLEAWLDILPTVAAAVKSNSLAHLERPAVDKLMTASELKDSFTAIFAKPSADPTVEAALAAVR